MEETRGITVKVRESLHGKAKRETEETNQTMSQFIEKVLEHYFNRSEEKEMSNTNKAVPEALLDKDEEGPVRRALTGIEAQIFTVICLAWATSSSNIIFTWCQGVLDLPEVMVCVLLAVGGCLAAILTVRRQRNLDYI